MLLFPLYSSLKNRKVVVVGGGTIAERKVRLMVQAGARVCIVSPKFSPALQALGQAGQVELLQQTFEDAHLDDAWFAIAATNLNAVNAQVAQSAEKRKIFVNVVDDPVLSSVHVPAIVNRSPLVISISSAGTAPMVARHVREQLEALVDNAMGELTALCQVQRAHIRRHRPGLSERRRFYEWLIRGPVLQHIRQGHDEAAVQCLESALQQANAPLPGQVTQICIASDDPGDVTLSTLRALNQADTVIHDEYIHADILDLARRDADLHSYAATAPGSHHTLPDAVQEKISALASAGHMVVVLTRAINGQSAPAIHHSEPQTDETPVV